MTISENDIRKICSEGIYKSGCNYFKEGRVHIRVRGDDAIVASVDSDKLYNVHIGFDEDGKISQTFCTCPYYQTMSAPCKHIVATYFTALPEEANKFEEEQNRLQEEYEKEQEEEYDKVIKCLSKMSKQELIEELIQVFDYGPEWIYKDFVKRNLY